MWAKGGQETPMVWSDFLTVQPVGYSSLLFFYFLFGTPRSLGYCRTVRSRGPGPALRPEAVSLQAPASVCHLAPVAPT